MDQIAVQAKTANSKASASGLHDVEAPAAVPVGLDKWGIVACGAAAVAFTALSWPMLAAWFRIYVSPDSYYAHAPIIPAIVALMLWHNRNAIKAVEKRPSPWALLLLIPLLPIFIFTTRYFFSSVGTIAFFVILWSSVCALFGWRFFKTAAFPLIFLITMAPLPKMILTDSTQQLQMISTIAAAKLLNLIHVPAVVSGNIIQMQNFSLFVDVPCSGFKLLLSLLTLNAALAYLLDGQPAKRFMLFLLSIPMSLVINAVRIALVGLVGDCINSDAARVFHDWSGLITLTLGIAVLLVIAKGLGCRTFAGWPLF